MTNGTSSVANQDTFKEKNIGGLGRLNKRDNYSYSVNVKLGEEIDYLFSIEIVTFSF